MSANPYQGFGYYSGLQQALAGQLRGEAEARRIRRAQDQVNQENAFRQAQALMQENRFQASQELQQQKMDAEAKAAAERLSAASAARGETSRIREERLNLDKERLDLQKTKQAAGGKGKSLTPMQQISIRKEYETAKAESDKAWETVNNTPGGGMADGPVTFTLRGEEVTMPRSRALQNIQEARDTLERIYQQHGGGSADIADEPADDPASAKKPIQPGATPARPAKSIITDPLIAGLIAKAKRGKTLTATERKRLENFRATMR